MSENILVWFHVAELVNLMGTPSGAYKSFAMPLYTTSVPWEGFW